MRLRAALAAAALASCVAICPSWGRAPEIVTEVDCPALSPDVKAELEARARVDLTLRSAGGGNLEVVCRDGGARLIWRPSAGGTFDRTVVGAPTTAGLIDRLLVAVAEVAEDAGAAIAPPDESADASSEGTPVALARALEPAAPGQPSLPTGSTAENAGPVRGSPQLIFPPVGAFLGGQLALFGSGAGLASPSIGVLVLLPASLVASAAADYGWAFGSGNVVSVRSAGGALFLSNWFGPHRAFELGAGASVESIMADAAAGYAPAARSQLYLAGILRARYALGVGGLRFAAGPDVRLQTPRSIDVDGNTVWKMPVVAAGIGLEVAAPIYGSLR